MPRVLIIEDLEPKFIAVQQLISREYGIMPEWARSISAAYGAVDAGWDLILLDMNFHVADDFNKHAGKAALAGIELLQFMSAQAITIPVIVITIHDSFSESEELQIHSISELDDLLRDSFPDVYRGVVQVDYTTNDWHRELLKLTHPLLKHAK